MDAFDTRVIRMQEEISSIKSNIDMVKNNTHRTMNSWTKSIHKLNHKNAPLHRFSLLRQTSEIIGGSKTQSVRRVSNDERDRIKNSTTRSIGNLIEDINYTEEWNFGCGNNLGPRRGNINKYTNTQASTIHPTPKANIDTNTITNTNEIRTLYNGYGYNKSTEQNTYHIKTRPKIMCAADSEYPRERKWNSHRNFDTSAIKTEFNKHNSNWVQDFQSRNNSNLNINKSVHQKQYFLNNSNKNKAVNNSSHRSTQSKEAIKDIDNGWHYDRKIQCEYDYKSVIYEIINIMNTGNGCDRMNQREWIENIKYYISKQRENEELVESIRELYGRSVENSKVRNGKFDHEELVAWVKDWAMNKESEPIRKGDECEEYCRSIMKAYNLRSFEEMKTFINGVWEKNDQNEKFVRGMKTILCDKYKNSDLGGCSGGIGMGSPTNDGNTGKEEYGRRSRRESYEDGCRGNM